MPTVRDLDERADSKAKWDMQAISFLWRRWILQLLPILCISGGIPLIVPDAAGQQFLPVGVWAEGPCLAAAVEGERVYVGNGRLLKVVDWGDPASPVILGELDLPEAIGAIEVYGEYLFVGSDTYLRIIDISDPANPEERYAFDFREAISGIEIRGTYAYLLGNRGALRILDISNPEQPLYLSWIREGTSQLINAFWLKDDLAYIPHGSDGLWIVDISNPEEPVEVSMTDLGGWQVPVRDVTGDGDLAFLSVGFQGIRVMDVTDPISPEQVGASLSLGSQASANTVYYRDPYLFCGAYRNGVIVYDLSDHTAPTLMGFIETDGSSYAITEISGDLLVCDSFGGLKRYAFDGDPEEAELLGALEAAGSTLACAIEDNRAYLANDQGGLVILDIEDPINPTKIGQFTEAPQVVDVAVSDSIAYLAAGGDGLLVLDVSDPQNIEELGVFETRIYGSGNTTGFAQGLKLDGSLLYLAAGYQGMFILEVGNPRGPVLLGRYPEGYFLNDIELLGSNAILGYSLDSVVFVDVSDPANPQRVNDEELSGTARGLAVRSPNLFVATGLAASVFDISEPETIVELASFSPTTSGSASSVFIRGDQLLIGGPGGLSLYDVTDPESPEALAGFAGAGSAEVIWTDELIFASTRESGLFILKLDESRGESPFADVPDFDGWKETWAGWLQDADYPWVYHLDHRWLYANDVASNLYLYDSDLSWWMTNAELYPWIYLFSEGDWYWHLQGTARPARWFYHQGDWIPEAELSN